MASSAAEDDPLHGLEPRALYAHFDALRKIPRPSHQEEGVRRYLRSWAHERAFELFEDEGGNVVVQVPARGRGKHQTPVAIQGHMDMVCAKAEGVQHDFAADPISLRRSTWMDGDRERPLLMAQGTTLGSDNGIGVAAALAVAEPESLKDCPPLDLIFTANEETGMTGALSLDSTPIRARRLLNLDAEEEGSIYLSCAGGRDLVAVWTLEREEVSSDERELEVHVTGLHGGHSGVDIHRGRGNAAILLVRLLTGSGVDLDALRLVGLQAGGMDNAIPAQATATLCCARSQVENFVAQLEKHASALMSEFAESEAGMEIQVVQKEGENCPPAIVGAQSRAILAALRRIPDGALVWSKAIEGLVETSSNLGILKTNETHLRLVVLSRSSRDGSIETLQERMHASLEASGAEVKYEDTFPGWEAEPDSPLVQRATRVFERLFGKEPALKAIHAGLECGILRERIPGVRMIAYGPEIHAAHTPREALLVDTVPPFWAFTCALLEDMARHR